MSAPGLTPTGVRADDSVYIRIRTPFKDRLVGLVNRLRNEVSSGPGGLQATSSEALQLQSRIVELIPVSNQEGRAAASKLIDDYRKLVNDLIIRTMTIDGELMGLAADMGTQEEWSQVDAQRRLVQQQAASEESKAFPEVQWAKFVLGIATTLFGIGSAAISVERVTGTTPDENFGGVLSALAFLVPWAIGGVLAWTSIAALKRNDEQRKTTYHALFGGQKYGAK